VIDAIVAGGDVQRVAMNGAVTSNERGERVGEARSHGAAESPPVGSHCLESVDGVRGEGQWVRDPNLGFLESANFWGCVIVCSVSSSICLRAFGPNSSPEQMALPFVLQRYCTQG